MNWPCTLHVRGFVYWTGLNLNSNASNGRPTQLSIMLILSDVPTTVPARDEYLKNLEHAIRTILNLSSEWNINITVTVGDLPKGRRFSLTSNVGVSIFITSLSAGPGDILSLQSKLDSPAFVDQLNAQGFKASIASLQLITSASGECAILGFTHS
jgi:hypothetical protein